jgi:flagellar basal body P-ring formation protein FlgA
MTRSHNALRPFLLLVFTGLMGFRAVPANSQGIALIPNRKTSPALTRIDETTQWALHVKNEATIHSPILRLRDVATPVDPSLPGWDRIGLAIIGLMPVDETQLVVELTRLQEAVSRSVDIPNVTWSGASSVRVTFHRLPDPERLKPAIEDSVIPVASSPTAMNSARKPQPLSPSERERIEKLIQYAIDRYDVRLREEFDIAIDLNQPAMESFQDLRRIDSIEWERTPTIGTQAAKVTGMSSRQPITAAIEVSFTARPLIVVARVALRRGHVLTADDLELVPAARNVQTDDVLTDISEAVGLQVQTVMQKNRPLTRSSIAPVVLIERGELVEVSVVGGGVTVATGAKTLASGAQGALIPIETLEPRRKLLARVTGPGKVEIFTRPPRVQ